MTRFNLCCLAIVLVENRHDLIKPDSAGLHKALDKADNLFKSGEYRWPILFLSKHVLPAVLAIGIAWLMINSSTLGEMEGAV